MFNKKEWFVKKTLRKLSKQRVAGVIDGVWIVEGGINLDKDIEAALRTCHMRGWVEPITGTIPHSKWSEDSKITKGMSGPTYRLTEAGWNIVHDSYKFIQATFLITTITLIIALFNLTN